MNTAKLPGTVTILAGAAIMMSIGMGMRQSLGLFLPPVTEGLAIKAVDFTFAVAVQNIAWGLSQAPVGAIADKWGLRPVMLAGGVIYVLGSFAVFMAALCPDRRSGQGLTVRYARRADQFSSTSRP